MTRNQPRSRTPSESVRFITLRNTRGRTDLVASGPVDAQNLVIDLTNTRTPLARLLRLLLANLGDAKALHIVGGTCYVRGYVVEILAGLSLDDLTWEPLVRTREHGGD